MFKVSSSCISRKRVNIIHSVIVVLKLCPVKNEGASWKHRSLPRYSLFSPLRLRANYPQGLDNYRFAAAWLIEMPGKAKGTSLSLRDEWDGVQGGRVSDSSARPSTRGHPSRLLEASCSH